MAPLHTRQASPLRAAGQPAVNTKAAADNRAVDADTVSRRMEELRPLASASRVSTNFLVLVVLWADGGASPWLLVMITVALAWLCLSLWREVSGRSNTLRPLWFALAMLLMLTAVRSIDHGGLLIPLITHPLTMVSLLYGLRLGMAYAGITALGLLLSLNPPGLDLAHLWPALGMLLVPPLMVVVSRPLAALRQRIALAAELERELDPRRGLQAVGLVIAERLRSATAAQRVIICHRDAEAPTVLVADHDDSGYAASPALSAQLLTLLAQLPAGMMSLNLRVGVGKPWASEAPPAARLAAEPLVRQLASLLDAELLQLAPVAPGEPQSGWMLVAYGRDATPRKRPWPLHTLAAFATEMRRVQQQASYADSLQAEIAAHERARIGRDLHDSAVQPYLGLKFAIDVVAQHCTPDNPVHGQIQDLRQFCETELNELRDTVAVLRSGEVRGDNTLVPALRRQVKRFATLFGIQTTLQVPEQLVASRALAGAVLHMVNEALNNVRRHTRAQNAWVSLTLEQGLLQLVVRDDAGQRSGQPAPAFEPRSLAERARELGGRLELRRHQNLDTEIHITIPV